MRTKLDPRLLAVGLLTTFALAILVLPINAFDDDRTSASSASQPQPAANLATVKTMSQKSIQEISKQIDSLVESQLKSNGEKLNPLTSDEVFLRRAYLDIIGRIATAEEALEFLASKSKTKRADLIDELLDSYGYVSRQYNFWADILRIKSRQQGNLTGASYIDFVKDSLEQNKPYDELVHDLISAKGASLERGNGAVGYYLRDRNMPEDNMSNTVRVFLGTRLECAQCHDHPFDKWTQRQYFEMVAFTGGLGYRNPQVNSKFADLKKMLKSGDLDLKNQGLINRLTQGASYGITGTGTGLARLPEGYQGEEGYEGEIVTSRTIFDEKKLVDSVIPKAKKKKKTKPNPNRQQASIAGAKQLNSREAYADWMTDPTNPRFATVIANRLWKQTMGIGLIEPIDVIEDGTVASNPQLMDYLRETMVALNFDMKQYLRAIYNSRTYQASAYNRDVADPTKFNFNGPIVRRMSAEQIWDSLLVLTVPDVDQRASASNGQNQYTSVLGDDPYETYEKINSMNIEQLKDLLTELDATKKKKNKQKNDPMFKKLAAEKKAVQKQISIARKQKEFQLERELMVELAKLTTEYRLTKNKGSFSRASEMTSPAPAGHFLRQFGQSDRETIENANTDPAIPQVLSMMNGYVERQIARDTASVLMQTVLTAKDEKECTDLIFLSMLNRKPNPSEARSWQKDFAAAFQDKDKSKAREVYADLIWMLANSNEFVFVK